MFFTPHDSTSSGERLRGKCNFLTPGAWKLERLAKCPAEGRRIPRAKMRELALPQTRWGGAPTFLSAWVSAEVLADKNGGASAARLVESLHDCPIVYCGHEPLRLLRLCVRVGLVFNAETPRTRSPKPRFMEKWMEMGRSREQFYQHSGWGWWSLFQSERLSSVGAIQKDCLAHWTCPSQNSRLAPPLCQSPTPGRPSIGMT